MQWVRVVISILIGSAMAFVPWSPWYRLGDRVQTVFAFLMAPGFSIDYLCTGQNGMNINRITAMNCVIYSGAIYLFLRRRSRRRNQDV